MLMRKSYKQINASESVEMRKRGQVAIFVIIAVIIVGALIAYFAIPRISVTGGDSNDPNAFMRKCVEPTLKNVLPVISKQGGYYNPTSYLTFDDEKIQYLCYTAESYRPCIVQQPRLVAHVEEELNNLVAPKARECLASLKQDYERRGYQVKSLPTAVNVSIDSENVKMNFNSPIVISKDDVQVYRAFSANIPSRIYYLLTTATSIIDYESTYGDSETTLYLQFYPDLKIEKIRKDSDTIYKITNVISKEQFVFATRSLVWPQGYNLGATS